MPDRNHAGLRLPEHPGALRIRWPVMPGLPSIGFAARRSPALARSARRRVAVPTRSPRHDRRRCMPRTADHGRRQSACIIAVLIALLIASAPGRALDLGDGPVLLVADRVEFDSEENVVTAYGNVEVDPRRAAPAGRHAALRPGHRPDGGRRQRGPARAHRRYPVRRPDHPQRRPQEGRRRAAARPAGRRLADRGGGRPTDRRQPDRDSTGRCSRPARFARTRPRRRSGRSRRNASSTTRPAQTSPITTPSSSSAGVPVLYTPYFYHPDPTVKRRSGFLAPSFGNDSLLGLSAQTPYYFALAPNYDVTLAPIFYTQENPVLAAEYRHLLRERPLRFRRQRHLRQQAARSDGNPQPTDNTFRGAIEGEGRFDLTEGGAGASIWPRPPTIPISSATTSATRTS